MNRNSFLPPFSISSLPSWRCSACSDGALALERKTLQIQESAASLRARKEPDWDPEWIEQHFSALLRCSKCNQPVFTVGKVVQVEDYDDDHGWAYFDALHPSFFEPATPIVYVPKNCPEAVVADVLEASRLYWASPPSAANRLRSALERLMDAQGIPKKAKNKKGKFDDLTLHARIERFAKKQAEVGANLLAIKWLGNSGSHSTDLTANDMLDAFELLAHALEEIYEKKSAKLKKLTAAIIKKKGPAKK